MSGKENNIGFLERAAEILDIPAEAVAGVTHIEITGTREFFIENHKGILEYTDTEIKINAGKNILRVTGSRLAVTSMTANELKLTGDIQTIEFIRV